MTVEERRQKIIKILYRRGHETISNLAQELGVSERTVLRDIYLLSEQEPIYTQTGRYSGGVYIMPEYYPSAFYFKDHELQTLHQIIVIVEEHCREDAENSLLKQFRDLIANYTKPKYKKGQ